MEAIKTIKEQLIAQVQGQMGDLKCVDAKELGEVIDMIKDLAQTEYYCEIYKQMKEASEEKPTDTNNYYYTERYFPTPPMPSYYRDMDRPFGRMYYPEGGSNSGSSSNSSSSGSNNSGSGNSGMSYYTPMNGYYQPNPWGGYEEEPYYDKDFILQHLRDEREGRSPMKRKMYMESKSSGQDSNKSMKELESYMQDLTSDMMDLLDKASPEEKAIVQKKVNTLASKIQNV